MGSITSAWVWKSAAFEEEATGPDVKHAVRSVPAFQDRCSHTGLSLSLTRTLGFFSCSGTELAQLLKRTHIQPGLLSLRLRTERILEWLRFDDMCPLTRRGALARFPEH